MTEKAELRVRFWGVRGSIPTPDKNYLAFGGNTPCVEIAYGVDHVFIDAGTGIRPLAESLPTNPNARQTLLFTHFHWDHIQGLPFFSPLYLPNSETTLASGRRPDELRRILDGQMLSPYFPDKVTEAADGSIRTDHRGGLRRRRDQDLPVSAAAPRPNMRLQI